MAIRSSASAGDPIWLAVTAQPLLERAALVNVVVFDLRRALAMKPSVE